MSEEITFSIVVPTYNRPRQLATMLESITQLDYARDDMEVIVVDDGSEIKPDQVIESFRERLDVVLLSAPHGGPARARQLGIDVARGKYLVFTDDDCTPAPDWLKKLSAAYAEAPRCAVGGQVINALTNNRCSEASQMLVTYMNQYYERSPDRLRFFTTNNIAFPREPFQAMGGLEIGWSLSGGEDRDLCDRWRRHGHALRYLPEMVIYHWHRLTMKGFWTQHFNYGRGAYRFHYQSSGAEREKKAFEPLGFYLALPLFPFNRVNPLTAFVLSSLLVLSQVANMAGFVKEWMESKSLAERTARA
jgi:glycosyltransferase involved in cell wall biosynthesis